jgi:hypothetical protein
VFAEHGFSVVLSARRADRLNALAKELRQSHGVDTMAIAADLSDVTAPQQIFDATEERGIAIDALCNNAGIGSRGKFGEVAWSDHAAFIQVMVTAVAHLTHLYEPGMRARGYGRIVNVASLAALMPGTPGRTLYGAAKSFVVRFSEALAAEHHDSGVHVTAVCPGFTYSEFHDVAGTREEVSQLPSVMWMDADTVARQAYDAVMAGDVLLVNGAPNKLLSTAARMLPQKWAWRLFAGQARKMKRG